MPLFYLSYRGPDGAFLGAAIVDSDEPVLARMKANAARLNPGGVCTVDRVNPQSVPQELIGKRLSRVELEWLIAAKLKRSAVRPDGAPK
jgi:hypothetical protein